MQQNKIQSITVIPERPIKPTYYIVKEDPNYFGSGLYTGRCKRGFCSDLKKIVCRADGQGKLEVKGVDKTWIYEGNWDFGSASGYGECTIWHHEKTTENEKGDISVYKGQWKNSAHEGQGEHVVTNKDGVVTKTEIGLFFDGNFVNF